MYKNYKVDVYIRVKIGSVWNIYSCIYNCKFFFLWYVV